MPTATNSSAGVAEQIPVPDPLASLDSADRPIAERICDSSAMKPNRIFADEKEYAAVEAFYQKRNLAPLWLDKGVANARGKAVIARIKQRRCRRPQSQRLCDAETLPGLFDALADADLTLTQSVLTYAWHCRPDGFLTGRSEKITSGCRNARPVRQWCWRALPRRPRPATRSINSAHRTNSIRS